MKHRPQYPLHFRSEEQMDGVRALAAAGGLSVNEWLVSQIEKANPALVAGAAEPVKPAVRPVKAKAKAAEACPHCERTNVKPWGSGKRCEDCKRNF